MVYTVYLQYRYSDEAGDPINWANGSVEKHYFNSYKEAVNFKEKMLQEDDIESAEIEQE